MTFNLALTNSGTAFYRIKKSRIILKNSQGQEVSRIEVPDIPVLPGSSRNLEFSKDLTLPAGEYLAEAVLDVGRSALLGSKKNFHHRSVNPPAPAIPGAEAAVAPAV